MAQQDITIGTQDAKAGDTLFTAFTKTQENFTELYEELQSGNPTVYLRSEDDLPNKTATTWTMDANVPYELAASFSTDLQCVPASGASLKAHNLSAYTLTFAGSGSVFKGTDVDFFINNISIDAGISNTAFEFNDTVGGVRRFIAENVQVISCGVWGKFTDMRLTQATNCSGENANKGIQIFGTNNLILSINQFALLSTSASFVGVDLGSAIAPVIEFDDMFFTGVAGGVGISGLASNGNVPSNRLARVNGCEFLGGITDLSGITRDDVRWVFRDNTPTQDTLRDSLIYSSSSLTTTISVAETYVKVNATWAEDSASGFSSDSTGKITSNLERAIKVPVDVALSVAPSTGTNKTIRARIALNGTTLPNTTITVNTDSGNATPIKIPWQINISPNDYLEVFCTTADATNVICSAGIIRVN